MRKRLTKRVYDVLASVFAEAEAGGFVMHAEIEPEVFSAEAVEKASDWLASWADIK